MKRKLKLFYTIIVNTCILVLLLEIGLGVFYNYNNDSGIDANSERIIASNLYEDSDMDDDAIKELYRELREQDMIWEPYLHYRFKPLAGKHNTIYKNGLRKTVNYSLKDSSAALKIFCFGGSTMYSSGARDAHTIPSELSKLINKYFPKQNVQVTNFGVHGYPRATEHIQLQRELIKNNIPDIVLFYDGVNEVISAHQNNKAGLPTNAYNRKKEFKIGHSYRKRIKLFILSSNLYRFVTSMQRKIATGSKYKTLTSRSDSLAPEIATNYIEHVKLSKSLENTYGFKVYNFIQPSIFSKKNRSEAEQGYFKEQEYYNNLFKLSYKAIREDKSMLNDSTFADISDVFNNTHRTVYFDFCHTGEYGNKLVANAIFNSIKNEINNKIKITNTQMEQPQNSLQKL